MNLSSHLQNNKLNILLYQNDMKTMRSANELSEKHGLNTHNPFFGDHMISYNSTVPYAMEKNVVDHENRSLGNTFEYLL